jgi:hypothetical protein
MGSCKRTIGGIMQRAIIVDTDHGTVELNKLFGEGWHIVNTCAMTTAKPSDYTKTHIGVCLVIVEKL